MYTNIKIYGGQDVNYMWIKNGTSTNLEVEDVNSEGIYSPMWDNRTIALATFNDTLSASDINNTDSIVGYKIQRKNIKENILYKVADLPPNRMRIQDYNVNNKNTFQYYITPIFEIEGVKTLGSPIITDNVSVDWTAWSIVGTKLTSVEDVYEVDEDNIWSFELNINSDPFKPVFDKTFQDGFGRFPKESVGNRNYIESGLETLFGSVSCDGEYINDSVELLEKWESFCANDQLKLIKDTKGRVLPIDIKETSSKYMDDTTEQVITTSLSFVQLADNKEISVYGLAVE